MGRLEKHWLDVVQDALQLFSIMILWFYDEDQGERRIKQYAEYKRIWATLLGFKRRSISVGVQLCPTLCHALALKPPVPLGGGEPLPFLPAWLTHLCF